MIYPEKFTVESSYKIPPRYPNRAVEHKKKPQSYPSKVNGKSFSYPFYQMNIGDSFLFCYEYSRPLMRKVSNAARNWNRKKGGKFKFQARKTDEGVRLWRVK